MINKRFVLLKTYLFIFRERQKQDCGYVPISVSWKCQNIGEWIQFYWKDFLLTSTLLILFCFWFQYLFWYQMIDDQTKTKRISMAFPLDTPDNEIDFHIFHAVATSDSKSLLFLSHKNSLILPNHILFRMADSYHRHYFTYLVSWCVNFPIVDRNFEEKMWKIFKFSDSTRNSVVLLYAIYLKYAFGYAFIKIDWLHFEKQHGKKIWFHWSWSRK